MADQIGAKITKIQDTVTKNLEAMIKRGVSGRGFIARYVYPKYKEFQMLRWQSENKGQWPRLTSEDYIKWKKKKFASAIGQGERMMIASGKLLKSVLVEPGGFGYARQTETSLEITLDEGEVPYAKYANEARNFTEFPDDWIQDLRYRYARYVTRGE
jgi:hypothetical protein